MLSYSQASARKSRRLRPIWSSYKLLIVSITFNTPDFNLGMALQYCNNFVLLRNIYLSYLPLTWFFYG